MGAKLGIFGVIHQGYLKTFGPLRLSRPESRAKREAKWKPTPTLISHPMHERCGAGGAPVTRARGGAFGWYCDGDVGFRFLPELESHITERFGIATWKAQSP